MNDQVQAILLGVVRHGVTAVGVWMAAGGIPLTGTQLDTLTGAVMVLVSVGWSWGQKIWEARAARSGAVAAAVASVARRRPVTVTVTPPGQPNIAVPVSASEAANAAAVPSA